MIEAIAAPQITHSGGRLDHQADRRQCSTLPVSYTHLSGTTHTNLIFDLEVPPAYQISDDELRRMFEEMLAAINETYYAVITIDRSYLSTTMRKKV